LCLHFAGYSSYYFEVSSIKFFLLFPLKQVLQFLSFLKNVMKMRSSSSLVPNRETRCQFHQCFTSSFYQPRSIKYKKDWLLDCIFCTFGICACKSCSQNIDEIDPRSCHKIMWSASLCQRLKNARWWKYELNVRKRSFVMFCARVVSFENEVVNVVGRVVVHEVSSTFDVSVHIFRNSVGTRRRRQNLQSS